MKKKGNVENVIINLDLSQKFNVKIIRTEF